MKRLVGPMLVAVLVSIHLSAADKAVKPIVAIYDLDGVVTESGQRGASMFDNPLDAAPPPQLAELLVKVQLKIVP